MGELRSLLWMELRSLWGINKFLHTRDSRAKRQGYLLLGAWVILLAMVCFYVGGLVWGLCVLGLGEIVPACLTVLASGLILVFGIFTAGNRLFSPRGYDLLAAMPLKTESVVLGRFLCLYVEDLLLTLAVTVPGLAVYGFCGTPGLGRLAGILLGTLFVPAIPLVLSALLGTAVLAVSARVKHKSLVQSVLMVLLVVAILSVSLRAEELDITPEALTSLARMIGALLGTVYPPALWIGSGPVGLALFALLSGAVTVCALWLMTRVFHRVLANLGNVSAKHNYSMGTLERRGLRKALYLREAKRYFSSSVYVTNTIIGPILGTIASVSLGLSGLDALALPVGLDLPGLLPIGLAAAFCMMTTTSASISMEGRQFWVIQSLPIPTKVWLDSKILLNLSLMAPFYLVSLGALSLALKPNLPELLWLIAIPTAVILFSVVFGITVNLKFHSFDWEREETVVKQSLSAGLGSFAGFFLSIALGVAVYLTPADWAVVTRALLCLTTLAITAVLYRHNNRAQLQTL